MLLMLTLLGTQIGAQAQVGGAIATGGRAPVVAISNMTGLSVSTQINATVFTIPANVIQRFQGVEGATTVTITVSTQTPNRGVVTKQYALDNGERYALQIIDGVIDITHLAPVDPRGPFAR